MTVPATSERKTRHVPARDVPIPTSISPEAQRVLSLPALGFPAYPDSEDVAGWRALIADFEDRVNAAGGATVSENDVRVNRLEMDRFQVHDITPLGVADEDERVYLDIHGGAFIHGGGRVCRAIGIRTAIQLRIHTWAVDYRMPPEHRFPAALDDCLAAYRGLLQRHRPNYIVVGGTSAGGNLAAALAIRAHDEGLPLPAALVLQTPAVDLTEAGDSLHANLGLDPVLERSGGPVFQLYAGGQSLDHPYLSPLNGDLSGFPPTILTTGTRDLLLSDTVRMHMALRAAGVDADLHVVEAAGHGGFFGMAPEDDHIVAEIRQFVERRVGIG